MHTALAVSGLLLSGLLTPPALAQEPAIGQSLESLLAAARSGNRDYAALRYEAEAAQARVTPAGALPDPKLRTELMDVTQGGTQNATLSPNRVGSTRYTITQEIPWFGKRELKREIAELDAEGAERLASSRWNELATRIKTAYAQLSYLKRNETLSREILDLMAGLEQTARARYASGLAAQQDVVRAQVEQTAVHGELIALESERRQWQARLNALLSRPAGAPLADPERWRPLPAPARLDYATLEERVRARNPQLFADEARLQAAEKSRELTYRNRYPDVTLGVAPNQFQRSVKQWDVMIEITLPLQQTTRRAQERESEALVAAARTRREASADQILGELSEALAGLEAARQAERLSRTRQLPQAELSFEAALPGYETGRLDFATLLDAQRQIRVARQAILRAQAEAQIRLAEIEKLLGEDL